MANYLMSDTELTGIADAIRAKSGGTSPLVFPDGFVSEVNGIVSAMSMKRDSGSVMRSNISVDAGSFIYFPVSIDLYSGYVDGTPFQVTGYESQAAQDAGLYVFIANVNKSGNKVGVTLAFINPTDSKITITEQFQTTATVRYITTSTN